jgi:Spy/CpxP family protein refolding chaperone
VRTWKVILATFLIFGTGLVTGALLMKASRARGSRDLPPPPAWVFQGPDFIQQRFLDRMKHDLALTPEQTKRMESLLRDSRERVKTWWEIVGPEMQTELSDVRNKIRAELTPEQKEKFEKMLKDRRSRQGQGSPDRRREHGGSPESSHTSAPPAEAKPR